MGQFPQILKKMVTVVKRHYGLNGVPREYAGESGDTSFYLTQGDPLLLISISFDYKIRVYLNEYHF
jgi:hypothetical protein